MRLQDLIGGALIAAHGGGYLPFYAPRSDAICVTFPDRCTSVALKKKPTEYLKQFYYDSLVFTPEALRHLVAEVGVDHIMMGTDYPFPWTTTPVDHILGTPGQGAIRDLKIVSNEPARQPPDVPIKLIWSREER